MQHFYDGQIRRYITQIVRLMSNFSYMDGDGDLRQVPVSYGDLTRQVANIMRDISENKLPSAPRMSIYVTGLEMDRSRTSDSSYINKVHIRERAYDADGKEYLNTEGKNYTVERLMPTPYTLSINADIWSSNTDQKLQILEQILMLFNPSLEIQTTDNYVDWTSLSVVNLERTEFSNRSIPVGVESEIDIATLAFSTPIFISPPAKVKRLGVITSIITNIFNEENGTIELGLSKPVINEYDATPPPVKKETIVGDGITANGYLADTASISSSLSIDEYNSNRVTLLTTFNNYGVYINGSTATIVDRNTIGEVNWKIILDAYPGTYQADISQIRLRQADSTNYTIGTISLNPADNTELFINWDSDTLPSNDVIEGPARNPSSWSTLDYIINPLRWNPTDYKVAGLRILILSDLGDESNTDGPDAWKSTLGADFVADSDDIIEWDGTKWNVVFDASATSEAVYISNLNTGVQYKWTGDMWIKSYEGEYSQGTWMIYLDA